MSEFPHSSSWRGLHPSGTIGPLQQSLAGMPSQTHQNAARIPPSTQWTRPLTKSQPREARSRAMALWGAPPLPPRLRMACGCPACHHTGVVADALAMVPGESVPLKHSLLRVYWKQRNAKDVTTQSEGSAGWRKALRRLPGDDGWALPASAWRAVRHPAPRSGPPGPCSRPRPDGPDLATGTPGIR
jgi:hypothetical protein